MTPPTSAQSVQVTPGQPITFSGHASDDEGLARVEIQLRNNTTGERLAADGTWNNTVQQGWHRHQPVNITGRDYDWSYTTPFNLTPGSYSFTVQAVDDLGLETTSNMQGRLTLTASIPGDTAAEHADHPERHPERRDRAPAEPGRHRDRRQGRAERPGVDPGERQQPVPPGQRFARRRLLRPRGGPRDTRWDQHDVDTPDDQPADRG